MARIETHREIVGATLPAAEQLWGDLSRWPAWVEGFDRIVAVAGDWPEAGASVEWQSTPAGRGRVVERVVDAGVGADGDEGWQVVEFEDDRMRGRQRVAFEQLDGAVAATLELDYSLKGMAFGAALLDLLFVRRALRDWLERTLERFDAELAAERERLR